MKKIAEIIAPGGSYSKAIVAAKYGAEAVYLGVPFTSLRMRQNKVKTFDEVKNIINNLHKLGTKAYLTMNIFPRNQDIKIFESVVEQVSELGADAIIFSDPGTFNIIRKHLPKIPLHMSTQYNTLNYESIKFWYDLGVSRIVLARELHINEIKEIKKQIPKMELEVFVHGAMCMSYSGRCVLGEYFAGRDANKGECPHVCRYKYKVYIEEEKRPGKMYEINENQEGTHIFSSKDLCTINRLEEIIPYVDGLKIEGRSKGEFYVGTITKAYRNMRDSIIDGKQIDEDTKGLVNLVAHRPYWEGFLFNDKKESFPENETINHDFAGPIVSHQYVALIHEEKIIDNNKTYRLITPKDNIKPGNKYKYISAKSNGEIQIIDIIDKDLNKIERATCNMQDIYVLFDKKTDGYEILYNLI